MQQSSATPKNYDVGIEECCMLSLHLAVPSCIYSVWHGAIPTSYFRFLFLFYMIVACGEMLLPISHVPGTRACIAYTYVRACARRKL